MKFTPTTLDGSYLIDLDAKEDERGFFARCFCKNEFYNHGLNAQWVQINNSLTKGKGTLRGLHFQYPPHAEVKLVRCLTGKIWDVIVDLRLGSNTYGQWFGAELSGINRTMMYVPKGFAHGFISLEDNSEILYLVSEFYSPSSEETLIWNDENVSINWPLQPLLISSKDSKAKKLQEIDPITIQE
ncbi:dTDP-4-dehydrorhamnose 3,5-epimerase [Synechococcus elongatus]|uniref:dTDP-4-dehydrorhamnose 3,5-epimerase n=1 Tax=Synechococcus elongatus PCC 11802 TaxID=2283154 RepID=A0AAU6R682_SYNEL|nr:dTDP-4-dehydrorhamnose 3,5-epimerase [Synechococcus elongatus]QFZ91302.1 dTDP-4-dehydrorhamnose 3,5-epimerase [Synechococcus elongatus PCC 11802]